MSRARRALRVETYEIGAWELARSLDIEAPAEATLSLEVVGLKLLLRVTTKERTDCKPGVRKGVSW